MSLEERDNSSDISGKARPKRFYSTLDKILAAALFIIILACVALGFFHSVNMSGRRLVSSGDIENPSDDLYRSYHNVIIGDYDAPVRVVAVLSLRSVASYSTIMTIYSFAESHPSKINALFLDLNSYEGRAELQQRDLPHGIAIIIDGSTTAMPSDGGEVRFFGDIGRGFTIQELERALENRIRSGRIADESH